LNAENHSEHNQKAGRTGTAFSFVAMTLFIYDYFQTTLPLTIKDFTLC